MTVRGLSAGAEHSPLPLSRAGVWTVGDRIPGSTLVTSIARHSGFLSAFLALDELRVGRHLHGAEPAHHATEQGELAGSIG